MSEFAERILEKHSPEVVFLIGSGASKGLCNLPTTQDFFEKAGIRSASGWTYQKMYAQQVSAYQQGGGEEISKVFNQIQEIKPESLLENILALFQLKNKKPDLEEFYTFLLKDSQETIALLKDADVLVPPLLGKLSLAEEFKFMYQRFKKALRSAKKLVIIGQSLRDEEIGNYVEDALYIEREMGVSG